ncbi:hypothetical protein QJS10_CPA07g00696 [Acorus calamus]|uniref:Uncharacterized protein n=1 Tax=Acorus calamus TaxID=4465 RepID=A0AAV9EF93_ACOCL|nr:hypothetical protein QJS10_CPA07g00696 [Acorus calamus]
MNWGRGFWMSGTSRKREGRPGRGRGARGHCVEVLGDSLLGLKGAKRLAVKLRRLKQRLRAWGKQAKEDRVRRKRELTSTIAKIDGEEEEGPMDTQTRSRRALAVLLKQEEMEWHQRSKALWLKAGDNNTKFFHKMALQQRRTNWIVSLVVDGRVVNEAEIGGCLVEHFKRTFQKDKR